MVNRGCHIRIADDCLRGIRKRTLPESVDIQRHLQAFIPETAGITGNTGSLHEDDLLNMFLVIVAVGLLKNIVHEAGHLLEGHVCLNVIPCRIHDIEQCVDVTCTHDLTQNCADDFLLVLLAGKVTGGEQMTFTCERKRLFTIQENIFTSRYPYRIGTTLTVGVLPDEFDRAVYDNAAEGIDNFDNALEVGIDIVVNLDTGQFFDGRNQTVAADRMCRIQLGGVSAIAGNRYIRVTSETRHRDLHGNRVDTAENHRIRQSVRRTDEQYRKRIFGEILVRTGCVLNGNGFLKVEQ